MNQVPSQRLRDANERAVDPNGDYVLYWMIAYRRSTWNFSFQRAIEWGRQLNKPVVVLEPLRCGYRWASDRIHQFVIQGMIDNGKRLARRNVTYYPYVEPEQGHGKGLLTALGDRACVVVSDDFPCFFLPRMVQHAGKQIRVRLELVDSNGILPMRAAEKVFGRRRHDFRRFLQKNLRSHLLEFPAADPLQGIRLPSMEDLPAEIRERWPPVELDTMASGGTELAKLPIDHSVSVTPATSGGATAAQQLLTEFIETRLSRYEDDRNQPQQQVTSGLSPYLHFGHISAHQVVSDILTHHQWHPGRIAEKATGSAHGWWGTTSPVESFLDELVTWREVGFNMCWQREDHHRYQSLPAWAQKTLQEHADDPRSHVYSLEQFENAETHNELWNAAQRQLVREGRIHNYLRMVWGKKILEWTATPQEALGVMIELNNKYALDGRDPNSYSGIFWCLGRYDRAWGPERPIFGKIRYMSTDNTARKVKVKQYLKTYGPPA